MQKETEENSLNVPNFLDLVPEEYLVPEPQQGFPTLTNEEDRHSSAGSSPSRDSEDSECMALSYDIKDNERNDLGISEPNQDLMKSNDVREDEEEKSDNAVENDEKSQNNSTPNQDLMKTNNNEEEEKKMESKKDQYRPHFIHGLSKQEILRLKREGIRRRNRVKKRKQREKQFAEIEKAEQIKMNLRMERNISSSVFGFDRDRSSTMREVDHVRPLMSLERPMRYWSLNAERDRSEREYLQRYPDRFPPSSSYSYQSEWDHYHSPVASTSYQDYERNYPAARRLPPGDLRGSSFSYDPFKRKYPLENFPVSSHTDKRIRPPDLRSNIFPRDLRDSSFSTDPFKRKSRWEDFPVSERIDKRIMPAGPSSGILQGNLRGISMSTESFKRKSPPRENFPVSECTSSESFKRKSPPRENFPVSEHSNKRPADPVRPEDSQLSSSATHGRHLQVVVTSLDHPEGRIRAGLAHQIREDLIQAIWRRGSYETIEPRYENSGVVDPGWFLLTCEDEFTYNWTLHNWNPHPSLRVRVSPGQNAPWPTVIKLVIHEDPWNEERALDLIRIQNKRLEAHTWEVMSCQNIAKGRWQLIFGISPSIIKLLDGAGWTVNYQLHRIPVILVKE